MGFNNTNTITNVEQMPVQQTNITQNANACHQQNVSAIPDASNMKQGLSFYKPTTTTWSFQLVDEDYHETYKVWNNNTKTFMFDKINDAVGREQDVADTKFMNKADFELAFPNCQKNTQYNRDISVNGVKHRFGFKKTQNDQLIQQIETIKGLSQNPIDMIFTLEKKTKDGTELTPTTVFNNIEYKITAKAGALPQQKVAIQPAVVTQEQVVDTPQQAQPPDESDAMWYEFTTTHTLKSWELWVNFVFSTKAMTNTPGNQQEAKNIWNKNNPQAQVQ